MESKVKRGLTWGLAGVVGWIAISALAVKAADIAVTVTDAEGEPLANAVVWVPASPVPANTEPYVMNQRDRQFVPKVLAVPVGSRVAFPNSDSVMHHVYSFSPAKRFEIKLYKDNPGDPLEFATAGVVQLGCNIHDWMLGYIVVVDAGIFSVTDANGRATLSSVTTPVKVSLWHHRFKDATEVEQHTLLEDHTLLSVESELQPDLSAFQTDEFDGY